MNVEPSPGDRADLDVAAVRAHDLVTDREPEAGAVGARREERLEDPRQIVGADAAAAILDLDRDLPVGGGRRAERDLRPGPRRIGGVVDEVDQDLAQPLRIAVDGELVRGLASRGRRPSRDSTGDEAAAPRPRAARRRRSSSAASFTGLAKSRISATDRSRRASSSSAMSRCSRSSSGSCSLRRRIWTLSEMLVSGVRMSCAIAAANWPSAASRRASSSADTAWARSTASATRAARSRATR